MGETNIEWTDATWNPTRGCSRVSPGCVHCYAERQAARNLPGHRSPTTGEAFAIIKNGEPHWTGKVELIESKLMEPLHWKKPRRVFVNSMSDLFHENLPTRDIVRVAAVMALTPWITYQVLTKRAQRLPLVFDAQMEYDVKGCAWEMLGRLPKFNHQHLGSNVGSRPWPLPNVWLGVSVENQQTADERIPELLRTPTAIRFVSYEPALGPVDCRPFLDPLAHLDGFYRSQIQKGMFNEDQVDSLKRPTLDWVIIGGESGPGARPFRAEWARDIIAQCKAAGVPVFCKQLGANPVGWGDDWEYWADMKDKKGGDWDEWPNELRVRQFPEARHVSG